ncbi:MAG: cold shock domain-containing protein [Nanoarchaeota archaeon]
MKGTVKWFNRKKGFGFIVGDDGQDYFVHHTAIPRGTFLRENDKVSFEVAETERGKQAQKVSLLEKGSERARKQEAPVEEEAESEEEEVETEED